MAIGASRAALVQQLLTESLLLAVAGGLAGIGVGYLGVTFLRAIPIPSDFPLSLGTEMDMRLLVFSLVVSLATGAAFGLVPALRATRGDLASSIKASDSGPARISILRGLVTGRNVLVTAQLALSVVLLVISADCIRGFQAAWRINEVLAHKLFGKNDPIGRRFRLDSADGPELQIVGLAKQGIYTYWAEAAQEAVWTPFSQDYSSQMYVEMRTAADPAAFAAVVRDQVRALDPDMPIFRISTMATFFCDRAMLGPRLIAQIVTATGVMGLFMAVIGLYGVVAYAVNRRTREIGIRLAIGATPACVMRMVLKQGTVFTAVGLAIGLALVIPMARNVVPSFVVGTKKPLGGIVLLGVPALLAAATMAACWIPALCAAKVDPT